jgi:hypothetical protein
MALEQSDCKATLIRETSQLETTAFRGSTSKRSITTLIIFHESMSKRSIILELEGGGAHGFARGDHHKD